MYKEIKDNMLRVIGYKNEMGDITEIYSKARILLGKHSRITDEVRDVAGNLIGKGIENLGRLLK